MLQPHRQTTYKSLGHGFHLLRAQRPQWAFRPRLGYSSNPSRKLSESTAPPNLLKATKPEQKEMVLRTLPSGAKSAGPLVCQERLPTSKLSLLFGAALSRQRGRLKHP